MTPAGFSLLSLFFPCIIGIVAALPVEVTTEAPTETTTIAWVANADIRKHISLITEFDRIREEVSTAEAVDGVAVDDSMIPMADIEDGLEATQTLIHKLFAIRKDFETKKQEYEAITTTTTPAPTAAPSRGFIRKLLDKIKFFD